jgi:hypothetical protein
VNTRVLHQSRLVANLAPISLLHNRTAIPLLVYFSADNKYGLHILYSENQILELNTLYINDINFSPLEHFFACGGRECVVQVLAGDSLTHEWMECISAMSSYIDIVFFPQHPIDRLKPTFVAESLPHVMVVLEEQKQASTTNLPSAYENIIPLEPWVLYEDEPIQAAFPFLALLQRGDKERSLAKSCSHMELPSSYKPLKVYRGGNGFKSSNDNRTIYLGHYTLKPHHYYPVQRSIQALKSALEDICAGYVFEILDEQLCVDIQLSVTGFLERNRNMLDVAKPEPYIVSIEPRYESMSIDVHLGVYIPFQSDRIYLHLNVERGGYAS